MRVALQEFYEGNAMVIKVRLWGEPSEVQTFSEYLGTLAPRLQIMQQSEPCADRGKSRYARIYLEVKLEEPTVLNEVGQ